ncbi:MAG: thiamine-phosphate kinase [Robiginitomaculum sp.]|nr:thiamine-phosphate kinase [Robiginitomaculum sp.]MDQ7077369.1 thiamine-phosphate kinase [Robiginitomaculum sp.]
MKSDPHSAGEFAFIAALAAKAAKTPEALGLGDDGAVLWMGDGRKLVLVADMLQAGIHALGDAAPAQIACKALRTNLSDLAAMGAQPAFYLSTLCWPKNTDAAQKQTLITALAEEQERFGISLIGGDTIGGVGPFTISITMLGWARGPLLRRAGAQVGDDIWVSGTIGDGVLGLGVAQGFISVAQEADAQFLRRRYEYPDPRLSLGIKLASLAHCAIDVSDGLIADAAHLAAAANVCLCLDPDRVPLSEAARGWLGREADRENALETLMAGGDDYELLFTVPVAERALVKEISQDIGLPLGRIGQVIAGQGVRLGKEGGPHREPRQTGFTHF